MADLIDSYDDLVQACKEALEDDSSEFTAFLPVAINNAELRLTTELSLLGKKVFTSATPVSGSPLVAKPSRYRVGRNVFLKTVSTGKKTLLRKRPNDFLESYWPIESSVGTPKYYSDEDANNIRLAPTPSSGFLVIIESENRPQPLSTSNQTNIFTSYCPEALFYATMMESAGTFARNFELAAQYEKLYIAARDAINNEGRRTRREDGQNVQQNGNTQNTLLGDN